MTMYNEADFERALKHLNARTDVLPENKKAIAEFLRFKKLTGRGAHRRLRYLQNLTTLSKLLGKPFADCERKDFERLLEKIKAKNYSESTQYNFRIEIKAFQAWLRGCDKKQYPKEVSWIEVGSDVKRKLDRDGLLTDAEVKELIKRDELPRDKALIALLFQTGARPTETLELKVKDFVCEGGVYGVRIHGTKTAAAEREVPVIDEETIRLVQDWLAIHPKKAAPNFKDASLWDSYDYFAFASRLRTIARKAGIKKKVFPYLFRHSRANTWANDARITQAQFNYLMGHSQRSRVIDTYIHTAKQDVFSAFARIKTDEKGEQKEFEELGNQLFAEALNKDDKLVVRVFRAMSESNPEMFKRWLSTKRRDFHFPLS